MYRVDLDIFAGPLDLLLFLVKRHEVDIFDIPIARITEQYLEHIEVLRQIDVDLVGDFLVMASTLMEIKSRMLLPRADEVDADELVDPRQELVRQLLEYKKFKDAASVLAERAAEWREQFPRLHAPDDVDDAAREAEAATIREVELWDLVSAFGRLMSDYAATQPASIVYDETPIAVYIDAIAARLQREGRVMFSSLFRRGMNRSHLIGLFLAVLELVRRHAARAEQNEDFGEIWVLPAAA